MADGGDGMQPRVDTYGFEREEEYDKETLECLSVYLPTQVRRCARWEKVYGTSFSNMKQSAQLKRFIRKGIPCSYRPVLWIKISGASDCMRLHPDMYRQLLEQTVTNQSVLDSIEMDLHRTFPENIYFCDSTDHNCLRQPLKRVLLAIAHKNPRIGYCQGLNFIAGLLLLIVGHEEQAFWILDCMLNIVPEHVINNECREIVDRTYSYLSIIDRQCLNFIAGLLLLIVRKEEDAFWVLDCMLNRIIPDYYNPDMVEMKAEQELLSELVKWKCPSVAAHLDNHGVSWLLLATKWFICLFADVLPTETTLRIWDCLLNEGTKVLYRTSVTLVLRNQEKILAADSFPEIVKTFKSLLSDRNAFDCHSFMADVFKLPGSFPQSKIQKLRAICLERERAASTTK